MKIPSFENNNEKKYFKKRVILLLFLLQLSNPLRVKIIFLNNIKKDQS